MTVTQVAQGTVPVELNGLGHVQAFNQVTIRPQVSGQITQIDYRQGRVVQKGQLLVQIDPRPFQAKVDQDKANLERDLAHLANARTDLNRDQPLARSGYVSAQQADTQQSMVAQELAAVAADKAVLEQDQLSLDYTAIKSPITGVAGLRLVDIGNVVQPSDPQGLVTVTQVTPIAMLFTLPQAELPDVQDAMNQERGQAADGRGLVRGRHQEAGDRAFDRDQQQRRRRQRHDHAACRVHQPGRNAVARRIRAGKAHRQVDPERVDGTGAGDPARPERGLCLGCAA